MRRNDREVLEIENILEILKEGKFLHLSMFDDEYPYSVPVNYGFEYINDEIIFYIHSAKEGHKLNLISKNSKVFVNIETGIESYSGEDKPCKYSTNFSSFIGRGDAFIVNEVSEKVNALKILMKTQTGRDFEISEKMSNYVSIIKIVIKEFSAKSNLN